MAQTVLILGSTGKIGKHAAIAFADAGWIVRKYDRANDDLGKAAQGVQVIVNGLNPPNYHDWAGIIPQITREVIAAAKASGATVIVPGNIYNFGVVNGVIDEATQQHPCSRKGRIRVEMEAAYHASGVQTIVLRAGNFMDPDHNGDIFSTMIVRKARKGVVSTFGNPKAKQAYAYLPDWARAAVMLAERRATLAQFEDVPFAGYTLSVEDVQAFVAGENERPVVIKRFPWWSVNLVAPFWELARELREMRYLNNMSHAVSGVKLARLLPAFVPTDQETAMRACLPD